MAKQAMKNLILICGDEAFLKEQKKKELLAELHAEGSMNFNMFDQDNLDPEEIGRLIVTLPFLEEHRTLLLSGTGWCKGDVEDSVTEAFSEIPSFTYVILVEKDADASNKLYQMIRKQGEVFRYTAADSKKGRDALQSKTEIRGWARDYLQAAGRSIGGADLNRLTELCGYDMQNLSTEMEKLICYTMDREAAGDARRPAGRGRPMVTITGEDIDSICSKTLTDRVFEMASHRLAGRTDQALRILEELFAMKVAPMRILYILVRQYQQAFDLKECQRLRLSDAEIMARMEIKDWLLRKIKEQSARISREELQSMLEQCAALEYKVKSGDMPERIAVEMLVCN